MPVFQSMLKDIKLDIEYFSDVAVTVEAIVGKVSGTVLLPWVVIKEFVLRSVPTVVVNVVTVVIVGVV